MLLKRLLLFVFIATGLGLKPDSTFLIVEGLVTVDGNPVKASIEINSLQKHRSFNVNSDNGKIDGNFATRLPAGDEYEIVVKVERFPQQVISLNAFALDSTAVLNVFADFTSPEYDRKLEELIRSTKELLRKNGEFDTRGFARDYGHVKKKELEYRVQIGAYKFYENFNYNNVLGFPKIIRKTESDQVTRFTMGSFETYNDALVLLDKLRNKDLKDAFIVASYKAERKMLQQLLDEKIMK